MLTPWPVSRLLPASDLMNLVTIVPVDRPYGEPLPVIGTRVRLEDGSFLDGVQRIVLTADASGPNMWIASIDVLCRIEELENVKAMIHVNARMRSVEVPPDQEGISRR